MTYVPKPNVMAKLARKLRKFQNVRKLDFKIDQPIISVTFDDFPKTALTIGARELEARGWTGTYYTAAGLEGQSNHHGPLFEAADLPRLEAAGHEIAGHTYHHLDCVRLSENEISNELVKNRSALKDMGVKAPVTNFAYPFGQSTAALKGRMETEFNSLRGITDGVHAGRADLNELKSCGYYSDTAAGVIERIEQLKSRPAWLTIFTHDIQPNPTQWGCTESEFIALCKAIEKSGARVMTVRDALKTLEAQHG